MMRIFIIKNKDNSAPKTYRQLSQRYTKLPHIYGLPKIHKDGIPLKPIGSNRSSTYCPLSGFLIKIISQELCPFRGKNQQGPYSFQPDVVTLFTRAPTDETLTVVPDRLAANTLLEERTSIPIDNFREMWK